MIYDTVSNWMPRRFNVNILRPDYCWELPQPKFIATSIPPTPRLSPRLIRRFWGYVHKLLRKFSYLYYCRWCGVKFDPTISQLPFGVLLKWSDGTRLEEALATEVMRKAGFPVPKVICYGEHTDPSNIRRAPASILMTRVPGESLYTELWESYVPKEKATIVSELKYYLDTMRRWENLREDKICSVAGTWIRGLRVPDAKIFPCKDEKAFNAQTMAPTQYPRIKTFPNYEHDMQVAERLHSVPHRIVFSHGDLYPWNIQVSDDGHVVAILDWEAAGWYPEYWEFTTAMRSTRAGWLYDISKALGSDAYLKEFEEQQAVNRLICDSLGWLC